MKEEDLGTLNAKLEKFKAELEEKESKLLALNSELQKARERERDLEGTRKAMLYMLEDLNETRAVIERAKREWEATFDGISDPLFIHDRERKVIRCNSAYQVAAGVSMNEIIGRPYYEIFPKMDGPFKMCEKALELQEEKVLLPTINKIFRIRQYPLRNTNREHRHCIHVLEDITEAKKAEERLKQEMEATSHLLMIAQATAYTTHIDKLMDQVVRCVRSIMGCNICLSYLWDKTTNLFRPSEACGLSSERIPLFRTESLEQNLEGIRKVMEEKRPMIDTTGRSLESMLPWLQDTRAVMVINPLIRKEHCLGLIIGIHTVTNPKSMPGLTERDRRIMEGISQQVSMALEEATLYKDSMDKAMELSHRIETIQVMHEIDRSILSTLKGEEVIEIAARMVTRVVPCDRAEVIFVDQEKQELSYGAGFGITSVSNETAVPFGDTNATVAINTERPQYLPNLMGMKELFPVEEGLMKEGLLSHIRVPLMVKGEVAALLSISARRPSAFTPDDLSTLEKIAGQISVALENARLFRNLKDLLISTVTALASAIDAKSPWTKGHSERVTKHSLDIAQEVGLDEKEIETLLLGGLLHDIGKIGTMEAILDKPAPLTKEEFNIMKQHTINGTRILEPIKELKGIIPIVRNHHEKYDGTGYPDGLKGVAIPKLARLLAVADAFDSMTADRPYRPSPGKAYAISEFKRCSGTQFDPAFVDAFLRVLE